MADALQYRKRACRCTTTNMMSCRQCGKCLKHCTCKEGHFKLAKDMAKARLDGALSNALKEIPDGNASDEREREGLLEAQEGATRVERRREFTIRSCVG